jgi:hypothetical protein
VKAKDFQIVFFVAVVSLVASVLLSGVLFSTDEDRSQKVETAEPITTDFNPPDNKYFNSSSFNPAKEVPVGQDPNSNPFLAR